MNTGVTYIVNTVRRIDDEKRAAPNARVFFVSHGAHDGSQDIWPRRMIGKSPRAIVTKSKAVASSDGRAV